MSQEDNLFFIKFMVNEAIPTNEYIMRERHLENTPEDQQRMKIISEMIELHEAGLPCPNKAWNRQCLEISAIQSKQQFLDEYKKYIKDSVPSELADVVISCMTLMILRARNGNYTPEKYEHTHPLPDSFLEIIGRCAAREKPGYLISWCIDFADINNINLELHVKMKLRYNWHRTDWMD